MLTLCGCNLKQEDDKSSILVTNDATSSYEMTQAQKGMIQKTKVLVANYQQVRSENLSFNVNGRRLEAVYVSMGDTVEKGDLLAEVYCDDEKKELANLEYRIKTQEMKIEHLKEQKELELTQLARRKGGMSSAEYENQVRETEEKYRLRTEDIEDSIYIARLQYDELYQWVEGCKLYAGMDGTITYMRDTGSSFVSWSGSKVLTISDSAECAFLCDDIEYASYFTVGDTYVFSTSTGVEYETVLEEINEEEGILRFELKVPRYDMTLGTRVLYSLVLEEKEDALNVPKNAVHYAGDAAYVYYFDEDGSRQMKAISVGLQADSKVEILSGLAEGEEVILR
jgi:RND family efflux transporter MFP subunit